MASRSQTSAASKHMPAEKNPEGHLGGSAAASGGSSALEIPSTFPDSQSMLPQTDALTPTTPYADSDGHPRHDSIKSSAGQTSNTALTPRVNDHPGVTPPLSTSGASSGSTPSSRSASAQDMRDRLTEEWIHAQNSSHGVHALAIRLRDTTTRSAYANGCLALGNGGISGRPGGVLCERHPSGSSTTKVEN